MTDLHRILVDGLDYQIALPHRDTDYIQGKIAKEGAPYELSMLRVMAGRLAPGDLVLDVGANVGNHSLYLAAAGFTVHAFEPNDSLCDALQQSIRANSFESCLKLHTVAIGARPGKAHFNHLDSSNLGAQSLAVDHDGSGNIQLIRIDDIKFDHPIKAIKIDIEGMELPALLGAVHQIEQDRPALYIECQTEDAFTLIHDWVSQKGYIYWDTFNATPTHLFLDERTVRASQRFERLMRKAVLDSYRVSQQVKRHSKQLQAATSDYRNANSNYQDAQRKYREACQKISALQEQLQSINSKHDEVAKNYRRAEVMYREACQKIAALEEQLQSINSRHDEVAKNYRRAEAMYREASQKISAIKSSQTFRAGLHVRAASRSIVEATRLPLRLWRLRRVQKTPPKQHASVINALRRHVWKVVSPKAMRLGMVFDRLAHAAPVQLLMGVKRRHNQKRLAFADAQLCTERAAIVHDPTKTRYTKDLVIACILDEFTTECLSHEVNLVKLTQEAWQRQLEEERPDFLLVESCWRGNDDNWGTLTKGSGGRKKLNELLRYCERHNIPSVFWNKEDPTHYEKFGPIAQLFDLAITTDINMVQRYKADFRIDVHALSFGAQPKIHNPTPVIARLTKAVFAGSYYSDKPKRCSDFEEIMGQVEQSGLPYDIFDRNYRRNIDKFVFPRHYQHNIVGNLPPDEAWKAHKGYKYQININSVQDSATMFARRVYESLASGTPVISNDSVGVRQLFGDVAIMAGEQSIAEQLRTLEASPTAYQDLARRGVRAVMREHTYGHRIQALCRLLGMAVEVDLPKATLALTASSASDIQRAKQLFDTQTAPRKHLFIALDNFDTAYQFLNESSDTITYAMQSAHEFYANERQFYGCDRVLKRSVNDTLAAEALEDFIYWGEVTT